MSREDLLEDTILSVDSSTTTKASKALLVTEIVGEQSKSFAAAVKDLSRNFPSEKRIIILFKQHLSGADLRRRYRDHAA